MKKIFVRQLQHEKQQQKLIKFVQKVETKQLIRKIGIHFQNKTCKELVEHCCSFEMRGQPSSYTKNCICDAIFCGIYRKLLKNTDFDQQGFFLSKLKIAYGMRDTCLVFFGSQLRKKAGRGILTSFPPANVHAPRKRFLFFSFLNQNIYCICSLCLRTKTNTKKIKKS